MTLFIASVVVALSISALCSLLEATLLSFTPSQVANLSKTRPRVGAIWQNFKDNIEKPIAVILIVNTAAHTIGATIAGAQFEKVFGAQWIFLFSLVFTYLMLQFTEILPKTLGVRYNRQLAVVVARPLSWMVGITAPILWFIHLIGRPFEGNQQQTDTTLEEIAALAASARYARIIDPRQEQMIRAATHLDALRVRQIMTPRTEVEYLSIDQPVDRVLQVVQSCPYTRLPLCDPDIDHIVGLVHVKDLFNHLQLVPGHFDLPEPAAGDAARPRPGSGLHVIGSGTVDLSKLRRDVLFVPDHTPAMKVMRRMQEARIHFAVVVDEYGSTLGIVTLEDIIEEMVGDIRDEFDPHEDPLITADGANFRISGRLPLHDLRERFPTILLEDEDVDTLGGYVAMALGRLANPGDTLDLGPYEMRVTQADARRVAEVLLVPKPGPEGEA